jgi:SPP1 gp7 family putative phage head morphogenesis protein
MPVAIPRNLRLGLIEPEDAVAAFERKHLLLPSFLWGDVYAQEHARGVAVAGVMKWDVLQAFADEIALTIADGGDLRAFSRRVQAMLEKKGMWGDVEIKDPATGELRTTKFDKKRLELIFDVNTRQAYSTGRWKRIEANKARQPLVMYRTMDDGRVRLLHSQWHGVVLPVESPFWDAHYPPNGWRCRCTAFAVSEKDIARFAATGMKIKREAPPVVLREYVNKRTGVITHVPAGIDPGFEYNSGRRLYLGLTQQEQAPGTFKFQAAAMEPHTRLPVARPIDASMLMPKGLPDAEYLAAFKAAFDNKPVFTDVTGDTLLINDDFFRAIDGTGKVQKRGREQFIKLIALAIQSPDEIWMLEGFHVALKKNMLRRRYIARFLVDGDPKPVLAVLELDGKTWTGVTGYQAEADSYDAAMLVNARMGERVYARVK